MRRSARTALLATLALAGCKSSNNVDVRYHLLGGIVPTDVVRVETLVNVDPSDARMFYADQPYREVATGVGYEVRDLDGSGTRTMRITFDATLGYTFAQTFRFSLLPPVGERAPKLVLASTAMGASDAISAMVSVGATFGQAVDVNLTDTRCGSQSCPADQTCCNNACARTAGDVANCGSCGMACGDGGDSCSGGTCRCAGGSACTSGKTCCPGLGCVDLTSDAFHCGACSKACNRGESCVAGVCKCGSGAACAAGELCCISGGSATCSSTGVCMCGATTCAPGQVCCGTQCADTATDNANCGVCGHACVAPLACSNGECACNGGICTGGDTCCASGCRNLQNDPANCGACGFACGMGERCGPGPGPAGAPTCLCAGLPCPSTHSCCGTSCIDTDSNFSNCGACGHSCRQGEVCLAGRCTCNGGAACSGNDVCCPPSTSGGGGCFDLANGPQHCGSCTNGPCNPSQICRMGMCVGGGGCNPPCTNGNQCNGGVCSCNNGPACGGAFTCCSSGCVDLSRDPNNCDACGHTCAPDPLCCGGVCKPHSRLDCKSCGDRCAATDLSVQQCCPPCTPGGDYQCANKCLPCVAPPPATGN